MNDYGFSTPVTMMPPPAPLAATSFYNGGSQRPTFGEDGSGMPYNAMLNSVGSAVINQDISYDTSSKDPQMMRARLFIGNLIRGPISRDDLIDLFKPFGKLLALTFFKQGYAFVQFSEAHEADAACTNLNGKRWKGSVIDVHLAITGPGTKKKYDSNDPASRKRRFDEFNREESSVMDETAEQNKRNRDIALRDSTTNDDLAESAMADTLICGSCRFVTCDFESYKDHRIAGCRNVRDETEPRSLRCASCNQRFISAWALMCHLTDFHRMMLFKLDKESAKDDDGEVPAKKPSCAPTPPNGVGDVSVFAPGGASSIHDTSINEDRAPSAASAVPIGTSATGSSTFPSSTTSANGGSMSSSSPQWTPLMGQTLLAPSKPSAVDDITSMYGIR